MSTGFGRWSNNDGSNLNIRAVRFGLNKPILETELNELQDLTFQSISNTNRVNNKPNTFTSNVGSSLYWKYTVNGDTTTAQLVLNATSMNDVVKLVFSGGVEYFLTPTQLGEQTLSTLVLPTNANEGQCLSYVSKAKFKTVSPDPTDVSEYDTKVSYAVDPRYPSLVSTKRVILTSGFDGVYSDVEFSDTEEEYLSIYNRLMDTKITSMIDDTELNIILGSWRKTADGWSPIIEITKEIMGVEEPKYKLLSDGIETYGTYSVTPLFVDTSSGASTCEVRLDFPVKSIRYGYFALMIDDELVTEATPINHPLRTSLNVINNSRVCIALYDLRDIVVEEEMWGNYTGQSWEDLLNQKWFAVDYYSVPSLKLTFNEVSKLGDVSFGSLSIKR